ncbi:MAG: cytochrome B6, partial [Pyrinomonadaceae bacterium]
MNTHPRLKLLALLAFGALAAATLFVNPRAGAQDRQAKPANQTSFSPVIEEPFPVVRARDKAAKPGVMSAHLKLLAERYDLARRVDDDTRMTRGKPIPVGPTARLRGGATWDQLGRMTPAEIRDKDLFPYLPLPHVAHAVGGMVFPQTHIKMQP